MCSVGRTFGGFLENSFSELCASCVGAWTVAPPLKSNITDSLPMYLPDVGGGPW